ncbi:MULTISPECIES: SulP family inorganic anion transporter [Serratia]|uniref:SulP family inorganic anion transporter n=1 Tax=Serratia TaxID=613 RepID=UPI0015C62B7F|nr:MULTISPECIES: SulP family inorganic anion transporter [Serratia]MBP0995566.1 SulP family inorganic anion transporter [Serratia fonticola]MBP1001016.1 SulP family inorganic anion transporter [Serratia fonticola]MBP1010427.1 SulP family inorganic anion transporter [Serratia fonticola]MBP1035176.1 SulP family inorganic anion transporter [Serratia fonticola]NXZ86263.1 SulP family inorganic anion transporter [Serratia fonticola]
MRYANVRFDLPAGLVVFLVALPLCLGIAQASGVPPFVGLLTGIIGGLLVTLLSPSPFSVSGPAAGLVTIVTSAIVSLGDFPTFLFALLLSGIFQFVFGMLRSGQLAALIPSAVIHGMLAGIGILLILQQLPLAMGYPVGHGLSEDITLQQLQADITPAAIIVSIGALLLIKFWGSSSVKQRLRLSALPGPLIAVLWGCLFVWLAQYLSPELANLARIELPALTSVEALQSQLSFPNWQAWRNPTVYVIAMTIAIVGSLETLLSQEALKKIAPMTPEPSADKELRAQGAGNMLSGLIGGLPITSVIVRSSANVQAGAQSRLSILIHGLLLLFSAVLFTDLLNNIPLASLAAILIYTGFKLAHPKIILSLWRQGLQQFIPFTATLFGILFLGMLEGIALGLVVQLAGSLYQSNRNALRLTHYDNHYLIKCQQNLTFLNKMRLKHLLGQIKPDSEVIIDCEGIDYLDDDIREMLNEYRYSAAKKGIKISLHLSEDILVRNIN